MGVSPRVPTTPVNMGVSEDRRFPIFGTRGQSKWDDCCDSRWRSCEGLGAEGIRGQDSPEEIIADDLVHLGSITKAMTPTMPATPVVDGTNTNGWNTTVAAAFPVLAGSIRQDYRAVTAGQFARMRGDLPRNSADRSARLAPGWDDLDTARDPAGPVHVSIDDRAKEELRAVGL